ncbi:MAG: ankyrin repeat domain-containing protein [Candidatus Dadabacteria bacterium]|nr:ankyrin repeat domain-containing protein [Candidatus Dadabacteria bacterium]
MERGSGWELIDAAKSGDIGKILELLGTGVDVNAKFYTSGRTVLMSASESGHTEAILEILKAGADVNAKTNTGRTALVYATESGHTEAIRELLKAGADVNAKTNGVWTALMSAAIRGNTKAIRKLVKAGVDVNAKYNISGRTALMYTATGNPHTETKAITLLNGIKLLAKEGGRWHTEAINDIQIVLDEGGMYAVGRWHTEAIYLKRDPASGEISAVGIGGGYTEAIRELVRAGAEKEARDNSGKTAFDLWQRKHDKNHPEYQEISNLLRP